MAKKKLIDNCNYEICKLIVAEYREITLDLLSKKWNWLNKSPDNFDTFMEAVDDLSMGRAMEAYAIRKISESVK